MFDIAGEPTLWVAAEAVSLALLALAVSGTAAFVFRLYTRDELPEGASLIVGLGAVGLALNTRNVLIQFVGDGGAGLTVETAAIDVAVFVIAAFAASAGRLLGDRAGSSDRFAPRSLSRELQGPLVRATGRTVTVTLPSSIDDIDGYEPVADETKRALEGRSFDFPRRTTVESLREKLTTRLKEEHDVGYVDVDLDADGTVTHLGLGRRPAGLGPTLPPGSVALAVTCDPPFRASPGDAIQLWRRPAEGMPERVCTGELRAVVGSVATIVVDETAAASIDPTERYRLVTLPSEERPDREFAGMLRRVDETMRAVELAPDGPLVGESVGSLDLTVVAVRATDGSVETLPTRERTLAAGDTVIALGHPAAFRELQAGASDETADSAADDADAEDDRDGTSAQVRE